jgi:TonB-dependent receptor
MQKSISFKKKLIASAIASYAMAGFSGAVFAQDNAAAAAEPVDEVVVSGIRASLKASMDIKRDSAGVVDAISAEDMGKFPDTNIAESLQRITGVSISRSNGEGSKVTVRGFGEDYNLITLNGRSMPGASAPLTGFSTPSSRSFDFANIASEGVSAVEVYKTGKASISSGGIGATINLKTVRPLDNPGMRGSVGGKLVTDETNVTGDDITPELSGLFSFTTDNEMFGVGLSASHQQRDSGEDTAFVTNWNSTRAWQTPDKAKDINSGFATAAAAGKITNTPKVGELFATPTDIRYAHADTTRTRDNAQLVFQFKPMDNLTSTLDYTYAKNSFETSRGEQSLWFVNDAASVTFDNGAIKTPVLYSEAGLTGKDFGLALQHGAQVNDLKSVGLNVALDVTEKFKLALDAHNSKSNSLPDTDEGFSWTNIGVGAPVIGSQSVDFRGKLPKMFINSIADGRDVRVDANGNQIPGKGETETLAQYNARRALFPVAANENGKFDADDFSTQVMQMSTSRQTTEVQQIKIDGDIDLDTGSFQFGLESRSTESHGQAYVSYDPFGDWGIGSPGDIPNDLIRPYDFTKGFGDYNTTGVQNVAFTADAVAVGKFASNRFGRRFKGETKSFDTDVDVTEDVSAAYFQVNVDGELGGMKTHTLAGVRYESTDVTSLVLFKKPTSITWLSNNDFRVNLEPNASKTVGEASYSNLLPSLDFDVELQEGLKGRFSFSKTIARATYNNLSGSVNVGGPTGPTTSGLINASATVQGSPGILPLESTNFDTSIEWYYSDSSYLSFGLWEKRVANFIGSEQIKESLFDLRDPTNGPRGQAAIAALKALGQTADETRRFTMTALIDNNKQGDYQDLQSFFDDTEKAFDVQPKAEDPLYVFNTTHTNNNKEAKIHGWELAGQHFFGETGVGVSANYTKVLGDVGYNVETDPSVNQFALVGLSDTANASLIYENFGLQARISYNWRDQYLQQAGTSPVFVEAFSQIDFSVGYEVIENLTVSLEGINVLGANSRSHARTERQLVNLQDLGARYDLGVRYKF